MPDIVQTTLAFLAALTILIAIHEYGHYWAAKRLGVKVLRFSLGFGKPIWRHQGTRSGTEFIVSMIPLGGYVRMVDEREGPVSAHDLPHAFNRQPLSSRIAIVAAGPVFNFLLAVLLYWVVFLSGETGLRPVLGDVPANSLAAEAGFRAGDEITAVGDESVPTWSEALGRLMEHVLDSEQIQITVRTSSGEVIQRMLSVPPELAQNPDKLQVHLGFSPWQPELEPIIERIEPGSAAERSGLKVGDRILNVEGTPVESWQQWVRYVRSHPDVLVHITIRRQGDDMPMEIKPASETTPTGVIGRIGAAVEIPEQVRQQLTVTYQLGFFPALGSAFGKTYDYSVLTLKMIGRMLTGRAALENLSGPLSIAQYAGVSARMGLSHFLKFLAAISVSLGVLNLLPIPVLDGGHLALYGIEALLGRPLSEKTLMVFQQIGLFILISLMSLAFYLDLDRLFN